MLTTINQTELYKNLYLDGKNFHAYLFYSLDKELNNNIAKIFAKTLHCETKNACGNCPKCKQFESNSNPDLLILEQDSIKVEDVNKIIDKLATKPIANSTKIFVILNAENINEIAQNKLLKSLEEPNESIIFILTATKLDKILPTVLSRVNKIHIPNLTTDDKRVLSGEARAKNIIMENYFDKNITLTDIMNFETNENYKNTLSAISEMMRSLKTSADIPKVASKLSSVDKSIFLKLFEDIFIDCLNGTNKFDKMLTDYIKVNYSTKAISKTINLIEEAYKKQISNVNFSYIVDNLLFNILKEKYLCN